MACDTNQFKIGYQHYQPDPSDLCTLCGGNFGKSAMIECKDKIHICMDCVSLLSNIKREREKKTRDDMARALVEFLDMETDKDNVFTAVDLVGFYDYLSAGKIPGVRIE